MSISAIWVWRARAFRYVTTAASIAATLIASLLLAAAPALARRPHAPRHAAKRTHAASRTATAVCRRTRSKRTARRSRRVTSCNPRVARRPTRRPAPGARTAAATTSAATAMATAGAAGSIQAQSATATSGTAVLTASASQGTLNGFNMRTITDTSATSGSVVSYGWNGTLHLQVRLPADADSYTLRVRGDQCAGAPAYTVAIDGVPTVTDTATSSTWTAKTYTKFLIAGTHQLDIQFTNAYYQGWPASCLRNLYLDTVTFSASPGLTAPTNPSIPNGYVHQSGTQLLDGANNPLKLHGVNLGGFLSWEGWIWGQGFDYIGQTAMMNNLTSLVGAAQAALFQSSVYNDYITGADLRAIAADGLNVVRVPFDYKLLEDDANPFVYKQSGWTVLDNIVNAAKQNHVYVIPVMQAAPCAQNMAFVSDYTPPSLLWFSSQCQARTVAMWKAIAARYANENTIAGYDLLGEPVTGDQNMLALYQQITAAIRQVDTHHLLIYEGNNAALSFTAFTAPLDSNEMLSPHDYSWEEPYGNLSGNIATYDAAARKLNAPLYIGEFGQGDYATLQKQIGIYASDPLIAGWTDWTFKQSPGLPALQTIQESPAAQMLIDWMNNTARPKPTPAQAQQGMADFLNEISFGSTIPDPKMQQTLG